jgi:hypothetical protein
VFSVSSRSRRSTIPLIAAIAVSWACTIDAPALDIQFQIGGALASNTAALAAFERAAQSWEAVFTDPVIVRIGADLGALGPNVIGQASSTLLFGDNFAEIRDAIVADAIAAGDPVGAALPTFAQLSVHTPQGIGILDSMVVTQANLKALGFEGIEAISGNPLDGSLTFNTNFAFDYDSSDGVDFGTYDFQTAVAHEIGHILGFISAVDIIDQAGAGATGNLSLYPLDLFRFASATSAPSTTAEFTTATRSLFPGEAAKLSIVTNSWQLATGVAQGDGNQASHFKESILTPFVGLMEPTLASGEFYGPQPADILALSAIGWDAVPEPASGLFFAAGFSLLVNLRHRRKDARSV